jgi:hypothetical protein
MKRLQSFWALLLLLAVLLPSCSTDFEVYAPEREIRSVFCILNQKDSVQYVRVAKAYQVEGDAIVYAAQNDLSVRDLTVRLTSAYDPNRTWLAEQVNDFPKDPNGAFTTTHTVYRIYTDGAGPGRDTLLPNERYKLEIGTPENDDYVFAETTVPGRPRIKGELGQLAVSQGTLLCLPDIALDKKFNFFFQRLDTTVNYEIRVYLTFAIDGEEQTLRWGPTDLFTDNLRCNEGSGSVCYQFTAKELPRYWLNYMPENQFVKYTYVTKDSCVLNQSLVGLLPKSLGFEVTAVDEYLSNYMKVNDPQVLDLSGTKPEYTNLRGNIDAVGVLGSINSEIKYGILNQCSEALLHLNDRNPPLNCSW